MGERNTPEQELENVHAGHRRRMTESFLRAGVEGFSDVQILEFLLNYAISRRDTNPLAHRLLEEFGDLYHVFNASVAHLMRVKGVGERTACLIRLVGESWKRSEQSLYRNEIYLRTTEEIGRYLIANLSNYREERAFLLCLDAKCKLIELRELCRGDVNIVNLPYRKVVEAALLCGATNVVLSHNHVSGSCLPSPEDVTYTRALSNLLESMNIVLADHFIVSERSCISMKKSEWI